MDESLNDERLITADLIDATHLAANKPESVEPESVESVSERRDSEAVAAVYSDGVEDERNDDERIDRPVAAAILSAQSDSLFPNDELQGFRSRWDTAQASFVDEPRAAVEHADSLVANVVKRIAEQFASVREQLEEQWDRGDDVNTEDLRQALKRYHAFFDRLLAF